MARSLRDIVVAKSTNLVFSNDIRDPDRFFQVLDQVADHICMVKTHLDLNLDARERIITGIKARVNGSGSGGYWWLDDRKFADIGSTVMGQIESLYDGRYPDAVTVHPVVGATTVAQITELGIAVILVEEMSNGGSSGTGHTCTPGSRTDIVGVVSQTGLGDPRLLQLVPGVHLTRAGDHLDQRWETPESKVTRGADLLVVGRGIYESSCPLDSALQYKLAGWRAYQEAVSTDVRTSRVPIMNAAGIYDHDAGSLDRLADTKLDMIVSKSCTLYPVTGPIHYLLTPEYSLNNIGLANPGLAYFMDYIQSRRTHVPFILSLAFRDYDELAKAFTLVTLYDRLPDAIELNISCPNATVHRGTNCSQLSELIGAFKARAEHLKGHNPGTHQVPRVGIKISPISSPCLIDDIVYLQSVLDFVTCCNSIPGGDTQGALGCQVAAIGGSRVNKALSLGWVRKVHRALPDMPIFGCGGISDRQDIEDYIMAGASAVQLGTVLWRQGLSVVDALR
jgi:orotidine 5'-phosphate decarboxylase subfamily 1